MLKTSVPTPIKVSTKPSVCLFTIDLTSGSIEGLRLYSRKLEELKKKITFTDEKRKWFASQLTTSETYHRLFDIPELSHNYIGGHMIPSDVIFRSLDLVGEGLLCFPFTLIKLLLGRDMSIWIEFIGISALRTNLPNDNRTWGCYNKNSLQVIIDINTGECKLYYRGSTAGYYVAELSATPCTNLDRDAIVIPMRIKEKIWREVVDFAIKKGNNPTEEEFDGVVVSVYKSLKAGEPYFPIVSKYGHLSVMKAVARNKALSLPTIPLPVVYTLLIDHRVGWRVEDYKLIINGMNVKGGRYPGIYLLSEKSLNIDYLNKGWVRKIVFFFADDAGFPCDVIISRSLLKVHLYYESEKIAEGSPLWEWLQYYKPKMDDVAVAKFYEIKESTLSLQQKIARAEELGLKRQELEASGAMDYLGEEAMSGPITWDNIPAKYKKDDDIGETVL